MSRFFELGGVFLLLFIGIFLVIVYGNVLEQVSRFLFRAGRQMEASNREHMLEKRAALLAFEQKHSSWMRWERELEYSGWRRLIPGLSVERFFLGQLIWIALSAVIGMMLGAGGWGLGIAACGIAAEIVCMQYCKMKNLHRVNQDLMKFLDFLGNYSITAGELTGIFRQISKYMDEPLRGVLEACETEAKITGDVSMAVLGMAEKIEHPQFKQLVRNLEITIRYSADYGLLVSESRRSMREYLKQSEERKGMLREGAVNMFLLLIMSVVVLLVVNGLIDISIWEVLFHTTVGYIALGIFGVVLFLFIRQAMQMNK